MPMTFINKEERVSHRERFIKDKDSTKRSNKKGYIKNIAFSLLRSYKKQRAYPKLFSALLLYIIHATTRRQVNESLRAYISM